MSRPLAAVAATAALATLTLAACTSDSDEPAAADPSTTSPATEQPPEPDTWVVTLGDSYIAGEGARFAGSTASANRDSVDALGPDAYADGDLGEAEPGCHRAEVWPGLIDQEGVGSKNLACSGARTDSFRAGSNFKPGVDFYRGNRGDVGQLVALQQFAGNHEVTDVLVSVGGNDVGFGDIVAACVGAFLAPAGVGTPCRDSPDLAARLTPAALNRVADDVATSLRGVEKAMTAAGYQPADYVVTVATYPSPLPPAADIRYTEQERRNEQGGCPFFDVDADWANDVVLRAINDTVVQGVEQSGLSNVGVLDLSRVLVGHRLCERGVSQLNEADLRAWDAAGASAQVEWVNGLTPDFSYAQEALHPGYWGTQAMRACYVAATEADAPAGGQCVVTDDSTSAEELPQVRFVG